jgi:signal transduction protein with GAF and PtsI domain
LKTATRNIHREAQRRGALRQNNPVKGALPWTSVCHITAWSRSDQTKMLELRVRPVSPGLARGKAYVIGGGRVAVPHYRIAASVTTEERRRLESALQRGAEDLVRLQERIQAELGRPEAEIFDAHVALLKDEQFRERIWLCSRLGLAET